MKPLLRFLNTLKISVTLLCLTTALIACSASVKLLSGLTETEANQILAILLTIGINAEKEQEKGGTVSINVAQHHVAQAITVMNEHGLPRERFVGFGDVFKKDGLISSPLEERARYLYALSQSLEHTLTQIDGVINAQVHVVLPERGSSLDPSSPSSAAVFIKHREDGHLTGLIPQVRRLVTNSIPGLTADKVSVVMIAAQPVSTVNPTSLEKVWFFHVATTSASALRVTLLTLSLLLIVLVIITIGVYWKFIKQRVPNAA